MNSIAVLFAPVFEEAEPLTIVDIIRRANLPAETIGVGGNEITGGHGVTLRTDKTIDEVSAGELEMAVIPGGYPGVDSLLASQENIDLLREMNVQGKWLAAICAGPRALDKAGALENRRYTAYPGQETKISACAHCEDIVVRDGNVITSRGPATGYPFAFKLAEVLGKDTAELRDLLRQTEKTFTLYGKSLSPRDQGQFFCGKVRESLGLVADTLDYEALDRLAGELHRAKRVATHGLLKAETAAISLQSDLVMLGKNAVTKVAFREQADYLAAAQRSELIVIFSYTGIYFDYGLPRDILREGPKVWLVTGSPDIRERFAAKSLPASRLLTFQSEQDFASHPYQLQMAASLIAQRYGALYRSELF